jgi:hypothetical protein
VTGENNIHPFAPDSHVSAPALSHSKPLVSED